MFRAFASMMAVLMATAVALAAPCACDTGQAHALDAPERQQADKDEHECCESPADEAPAEEDCSCGECDGGDCAEASEDPGSRAAVDSSALVTERDEAFDVEPLSPRFQALLIAWVAEQLSAATPDAQLADLSASPPANAASPSYLKLQVLRL